MACHHPIPATQDPDGYVRLRQTKSEAIFGDGEYLELACGTCPGCRTARVRSWAIRAYHESLTTTRTVKLPDLPTPQQVSNSSFITLTYDDEHLPEDGSVRVEHFQNFCKKLRRVLGSFRYLHCGEYGTKTQRPHYHALIFGQDFHADRVLQYQTGEKTEWTSPILSQTWPHGFSTISPLNFATASYVAGYVTKKLKKAEWQDKTTVFGLTSKPLFSLKEEYITMSRRPGLGTDFFEKFWPEIYPRDLVTIEGKEYKPPKFYDRLLEQTRPKIYAEVLEKRKQHLDNLGPTPDNELKARGAIYASRKKLKPARKG